MARIREVSGRGEMSGGDGAAAAAAMEKALRCLGRGVDMAGDLMLKHCKDAGGCLVLRSGEKKAAAAAKVVVPGFGVIADVPADVKCGKGDRIRFKSDVLEFNKMSEVFNHRNSLTGKIPSGLFNSCFDLNCSSWAEDASAIKCLAFDGYFISLLDLRLDCRPLALADHVVRDVPAAWDPSAIASDWSCHFQECEIINHTFAMWCGKPYAYVEEDQTRQEAAACKLQNAYRKLLAGLGLVLTFQVFDRYILKMVCSFIEKYGTHIVVGLSLGGQDVVYVKQDNSSPLSPSEIKEQLDKLGDQLFTGTCTLPPSNRKFRDHKFKVPEAFNVFDAQVARQRLEGITAPVSCKEGVTVIHSKRGGNTAASDHSEWLLTVPAMPDAIDFKLVPITSLLKGVTGVGFLSHAINLYLRYKPPMEELRYFLDFQHHRLWAPVLSDLPLGPCSNRQDASPALHFRLVGSKLYVSSSEVIVPRLPVTGMRLHLEGKKNNRLGIHLQHLSNTPTFINERSAKPPIWRGSETISDERYYEPVQGRMFAHVCTVPVKYDPRWGSGAAGSPSAYIVSGAQLHVMAHDSTNILHLRLLYTELPGCAVVRSKWAHNTARLLGKGSFLSKSFVSSGGVVGHQSPARVHIDSGVFAGGPPVPVGTQRLLKFVETSQVTMGPQDSPGYWLVTGAKLDVEMGKISLHVKFSLLAPVT